MENFCGLAIAVSLEKNLTFVFNSENIRVIDWIVRRLEGEPGIGKVMNTPWLSLTKNKTKFRKLPSAQFQPKSR